MRKIQTIILVVLIISLVACNDTQEENNDDIAMLDVEFNVPDEVDVGETVELEAIVTYGDEDVTDADDVNFEVWEKGDEENSDRYDATNHGDGTYTAEVTFEKDGIFEMYAHTTARDLHTMPKREITVGEGGNYENVDDENSFHTEGFDLNFKDIGKVKIDEEVSLNVEVTLDDEHLSDANVRFELWMDDEDDDRTWIDAEETDEQYEAIHTFTEPGSYHIQIHVENDEDLHEHAQYEVEVSE